MENVTKERKIMTKTIQVATSKKGVRYLFTTSKDGNKMFVNLVKDNRGYTPTIPASAKEVDVEFTSFKYDDENKRLVLFGVSTLLFKA